MHSHSNYSNNNLLMYNKIDQNQNSELRLKEQSYYTDDIIKESYNFSLKNNKNYD